MHTFAKIAHHSLLFLLKVCLRRNWDQGNSRAHNPSQLPWGQRVTTPKHEFPLVSMFSQRMKLHLRHKANPEMLSAVAAGDGPHSSRGQEGRRPLCRCLVEHALAKLSVGEFNSTGQMCVDLAAALGQLLACYVSHCCCGHCYVCRKLCGRSVERCADCVLNKLIRLIYCTFKEFLHACSWVWLNAW